MSGCGMTGAHFHSIDAKGRTNFPAKLREALGESFWLVRGTKDRYLSVYSQEKWEKIHADLTAIPGNGGEQLKRWLNAGAFEVTPDKQGRILIPQNLRDYGYLDKDIAIIGAGDKVEIWEKNRWTAQDEAFDPMSIPELESLCL